MLWFCSLFVVVVLLFALDCSVFCMAVIVFVWYGCAHCAPLCRGFVVLHQELERRVGAACGGLCSSRLWGRWSRMNFNALVPTLPGVLVPGAHPAAAKHRQADINTKCRYHHKRVGLFCMVVIVLAWLCTLC